MSKSLYEIPLLPDELVAKKFERTSNIRNDPEQVNNFIKEALKYTGTEKALFEDEAPRNNRMNSNNRLTLMEHGRRYDHTPYHPEIFLGNTEKDVRGVSIEPSLKKVADQNDYRFRKYHKKIFKNDNTYNIIEGVVPEKRISNLKSNAFYDTASRLKIFDESSDNIISRKRHDNTNTLNLYEKTVSQSDKYVGDLFEQMNPTMSGNRVSQLSNTVGAKWETVPDTKFKISSYSNLYRSKVDVDNAVSKVFKMSKPDMDYGVENDTIVTKSLLQLMDNIKKAKKLNQSVDVVSNLTGDSLLDTDPYSSKAMKYNKGGGEILNTEETQIRKGLEQYVSNIYNKQHNGEGAFRNRMETFEDMDIKRSPMQVEINNMKTRLPDPEFNNIFQSILQDRKLDDKTKLSLIKNISPELVSKVITNIQASKFSEQEEAGIYSNSVEPNSINTQYKRNAPVSVDDYITNVLKDNPKYYQHNPNEITVANKAENTTIPFVQNVNNFEFDTEITMDNNYINRTLGPMGTKYLVSEQKFDTQINPLSETTATFFRK